MEERGTLRFMNIRAAHFSNYITYLRDGGSGGMLERIIQR
jgi:hypothetical protein